MGKITRFEELICWQKARRMVKNIYLISKTGPLAKDFGLRDQIRRASISSMANIAEGFARYHRKEFIRFLDIAQSSAVEVNSLLYVVLDQEYLDKESFSLLQSDVEEVHALILGLLNYVKKSISKNIVNEPFPKYGNSKDLLEIPDEFISREYLNT